MIYAQGTLTHTRIYVHIDIYKVVHKSNLIVSECAACKCECAFRIGKRDWMAKHKTSWQINSVSTGVLVRVYIYIHKLLHYTPY